MPYIQLITLARALVYSHEYGPSDDFEEMYDELTDRDEDVRFKCRNSYELWKMNGKPKLNRRMEDLLLSNDTLFRRARVNLDLLLPRGHTINLRTLACSLVYSKFLDPLGDANVIAQCILEGNKDLTSQCFHLYMEYKLAGSPFLDEWQDDENIMSKFDSYDPECFVTLKTFI